MSSSGDALAQLNKWKSGSTRLFMHSAVSGVTCWATGVLRHASPAELHFGIEGIDGKDFLFVVNVHRARFTFLDLREGTQFFAPRRETSRFGTVVEVILLGEKRGETRGRVVFAEEFPSAVIESPTS